MCVQFLPAKINFVSMPWWSEQALIQKYCMEGGYLYFTILNYGGWLANNDGPTPIVLCTNELASEKWVASHPIHPPPGSAPAEFPRDGRVSQLCMLVLSDMNTKSIVNTEPLMCE